MHGQEVPWEGSKATESKRRVSSTKGREEEECRTNISCDLLFLTLR